MQGFEFRENNGITIRGKEYECDITDPNMMEGIIIKYPLIQEKLLEIKDSEMDLKAILSEMQPSDAAEKMKAFGTTIREKTREAIQACQDFIYDTIGIEEYQEIFRGKKANLTDHIDLSTYIYTWALAGRENVINKYLADSDVEPEDKAGE